MSYGTKHETYKPVEAHMLHTLHKSYWQNLEPDEIRAIFDVMTEGLHTETLLFTFIIDALARFESGAKDHASYGFGAGIRLSAVCKNGKGKFQTTELKLLHDVIVEMQMAGRNFFELQKLLRTRYGATFVHYHSCGSAIISLEQVKEFYEVSSSDQLLRTKLDWSGAHNIVSWQKLLQFATYTEEEMEIVQSVFANAKQCIGRHQSRLIQPPTLTYA
ncbi:MAG: hypothetical protein WDZ88_03705 [Candidatus Paceibacterota bacterium]